MADKKTDTSRSIEADRVFLERHNIGAQMKDVLSKIVENRPADPIAFLADYFETLNEKTNRIAKSAQQLCLTHHTRPAFESNCRIAYDILSLSRVTKSIKGLTGNVYTELLQTLCKDFPSGVTEKLLKKIQCRDHEVVTYNVFRSGVFTCFVLQDFLNQSEGLYDLLDINKNNKADKNVCDAVVHQFLDAVSTSSSTPLSLLEAGHMLGPDKLFAAVGKALLTTNINKNVMKKEEFLVSIAEVFLTKVVQLR